MHHNTWPKNWFVRHKRLASFILKLRDYLVGNFYTGNVLLHIVLTNIGQLNEKQGREKRKFPFHIEGTYFLYIISNRIKNM